MEPPPSAGTQTEPDGAVFQSCEAEMTKCPRQPYAQWHLELPQRYFLAGAAQGLMRLLLLTRFLLYTEMIRDDCEQTFAAALRHINKLLQLLTDFKRWKRHSATPPASFADPRSASPSSQHRRSSGQQADGNSSTRTRRVSSALCSF